MRKYFAACFGLLFITSIALTSNAADSNSLDRLQGEWEVTKTSNEGQTYKQVMEIKENQLHFKIVGEDGVTYLHAKGEIEIVKAEGLNLLKITNIRAGGPDAELEPINDDRVSIYQLGYNTLTLVSNMDKIRDNQEATLDVYRKKS